MHVIIIHHHLMQTCHGTMQKMQLAPFWIEDAPQANQSSISPRRSDSTPGQFLPLPVLAVT